MVHAWLSFHHLCQYDYTYWQFAFHILQYSVRSFPQDQTASGIFTIMG